MSFEETGEKARPFTDGDELYQQRARAALPLLVRQAKAQRTIYYGQLAAELGMPNPRNLDFVLGSVGVTLIQLATARGWEIPPIQCVVVNQATELPGDGVGFFISKEEFRMMTTTQRRTVVSTQLSKIFSFRKWNEVLAALELQPAPSDYHKLLQGAARRLHGEGESEAHQRMKSFVAAHPELFGLPAKRTAVSTEHPLPSGDRLDVLFQTRGEYVAVEVKSAISDEADLVRGMFQCIKYQAVLEASLLAENKIADVKTYLALETPLPAALVPLRNMLGIECIEIRVT